MPAWSLLPVELRLIIVSDYITTFIDDTLHNGGRRAALEDVE